MPIYLYKCPACGKEFDKIIRHREEMPQGEPPCPQCGAPARKIPARTSFILKGNGFYENDYKKGKKDVK